jgi:site-specific DNA recombinase
MTLISVGESFQELAAALAAEVLKRPVQTLLDSNDGGRILDTSVPAVVGAYEERVRKLENDKLLIQEELAFAGRPVSTFDTTLRTALAFLANPWRLWSSERLVDRRAVLKLTFAERLRYKRNEGSRTPDLSLPLRV